MRVFWVLVGVTVILATVGSILRNLVVPRGLGSILVRVIWRGGRRVLLTFGARCRYDTRDAVLAWLAPGVLVATLLFWVLSLLVGYTLMVHGVAGLPWRTSFRETGSSLFTLGYATGNKLRLAGLDFLAAATGPLVVALQISYLPTLYAAYNRRETEVTLLAARAGEPAWGPELLARQGLVDTVGQLRPLYQAWERLAADLGESHANYPILLAFRSPRRYRSWIVGLTAVMDAAAMHLALAPDSAPPEARLMLRAGFTALRDIAAVVRIPFDPDPLPSAPISLSKEEFVAGAAHARRGGFRCEVPDDEAWPHFVGWRVNYEQTAYLLARRIDAVPAAWTGPRDWPTQPVPPQRPPHRQPDAPDVPFPGDAAID